ncbi:hypothetical protein H6G33_10175 [Calothrix sp. FACHB-1219]|uniref:hypothetical protein n=1 Tax=unclassified Calothrix TaxID=2619626 RepID=UPI00168471F2|nr:MULTISPECIES: hypothetical protein [unclassified Calothrix]MBD2201714.1 hypothetical protein [Calothrix sp. FACHB-168]MBD2217400.1 hypothetical protein [Calothrix sp. FACHB-1219]
MENLIRFLIDEGVISEVNQLKAEAALHRYVITHGFCCYWTGNDVLTRANSMGVSLTKEEAAKIILDIGEDHDGYKPITWETIEVAINNYLKGISFLPPNETEY